MIIQKNRLLKKRGGFCNILTKIIPEKASAFYCIIDLRSNGVFPLELLVIRRKS